MNRLWARGTQESAIWHTSQVSTPDGVDWEKDPDYSFDKNNLKVKQHRYYFDGDSPGAGQFIYIMEAGIDEAEVVGTCLSLQYLPSESPQFDLC